MIVLGECSNCGAGLTHCSECHTMRRVDQTLFGVGVGNCWPACLATITGIPLENIPNFCQLYAEDRWYLKAVEWLRPLGLAPWSTLIDEGKDVPSWISNQFAEIPWIATGRTPRGNHSCVYIGGHLYHDPNPCRAGLDDIIDGTFFLSTQVRPTAWK